MVNQLKEQNIVLELDNAEMKLDYLKAKSNVPDSLGAAPTPFNCISICGWN